MIARIAGLCILSYTLIYSTIVNAQLVYLCDGNDLATLNLSNGAFRLIGPIKLGTSPTGVNLTDIGLSSSDQLYGVSKTQLYKLVISGNIVRATKIGPGLGVDHIAGLTFRKDGKAIATSFDVAGYYQINLSTGRATGPFAIGGDHKSKPDGDLFYDGNHLYVTGDSRKLIDFNTSTSTAQTVDIKALNTLGRWVSFNKMFGLVAPQKGTLIGFGGTKAYRINVTTGRSTVIYDFSKRGLNEVIGAAAKPLP